MEKLRDADPSDKHNIVQIKEYFQFRQHLCIVFEMLSVNLYEHIKAFGFEGFEEQ